jgi:Uma2 family endonuclease
MLISPEEFLMYPMDNEEQGELVRGALRVTPAPGAPHGMIDYRACGTSLIWVVDPVRRTVTIIACDAPPRWVGEGDRLDGGAVLQGFSCGVADLFVGVAR